MIGSVLFLVSRVVAKTVSRRPICLHTLGVHLASVKLTHHACWVAALHAMVALQVDSRPIPGISASQTKQKLMTILPHSSAQNSKFIPHGPVILFCTFTHYEAVK